jgi:magnesium transporter
MSRSGPGTLVSRQLEERPGAFPSALFLHGGRTPTRLSVLSFGPGGAQESRLQAAEQLDPLLESGLPLWVRLQGLAEPALIRSVLNRIGVADAVQAPLIETPQRPRVDSAGDSLLVVLHRLSFGQSAAQLLSEQVGFVLTDRILLSLEEVPKGESFPGLTRWLASLDPPPGREDLDDILHFLIDELLDEIFPMLEQVSDLLDGLEEAALRDPKPKLLNRAYLARANLRQIRNQVWPLRHQILMLLR